MPPPDTDFSNCPAIQGPLTETGTYSRAIPSLTFAADVFDSSRVHQLISQRALDFHEVSSPLRHDLLWHFAKHSADSNLFIKQPPSKLRQPTSTGLKPERRGLSSVVVKFLTAPRVTTLMQTHDPSDQGKALILSCACPLL